MFWKHPAKVCMTYFGHMKLSFGFAKDLFVASQQAIYMEFFPIIMSTQQAKLLKLYKKKCLK